MSELLKKAFEKIVAELPGYEQEQLANWLIRLIEDDERLWDTQFAASHEKLAIFTERVLAEYSEGRTEVLDPEKL